MTNSVVFGIYSTRDQVETAVAEMQREGFRIADISVLFACTEATVIGGALESLDGIGVLVNPGLGPFVAAGPMMALLGGASAGSVIGGLTGALTGIGIPENAARHYAGRIELGCILFSVHVDDFKWIRKARKVLKRTGATDIAGETRSDYATTERYGDRLSASLSGSEKELNSGLDSDGLRTQTSSEEGPS